MTKIILSVLSVLLLGVTTTFSPVLAADEVYDSAFDRDPCYYTDSELVQVEKVHMMFEQNSGVISDRFSSDEMKTLVDEYTKGFIEMISDSLTICRDGETSLYERDSIVDMDEMITELTTYAQVVGALRSLDADGTSSANRPGDDAMRMLQEHITGSNTGLIGNYLEQLEEGIFLNSSSEIDMSVVFSNDTMQLEGGLALQSEENGNLLGTVLESSNSISLTVSTDQQLSEPVRVDMDAMVDVRMIDGALYIKLHGVVFDEFTLPEEVAGEFAGVREMLELLDGKWIAIGEDMLGDFPIELGDTQGVLASQMMLQDLLDTSWMMQYARDDTAMYMGLSPLMCGSLDAFGMSLNECLNSIRIQQYIMTDGKGFARVQQRVQPGLNRVDEYVMFVDQISTETPVVMRNENEITSIELSVMDYSGNGVFSYANDRFTFDATINEEQYDYDTDEYIDVSTVIDIDGVFDRSQDSMRLNGLLQSETVDARFMLETAGTLDEMTANMTVDISSTDSYSPFDLSMSIDIASSQQEIDTFVVTKPDDSETIDIETVMNLGGL